MRALIRFIVHGQARPKGSKTAFITSSAWAKAQREGRKPYLVMKEADNVREWMRLMSQVMAAEVVGRGEWPLDGPIAIDATFFFSRPKSRAGEVWHITVGDLDKLLRTVGDAGNRIVWRDDKQIVSIRARKIYTDGTPCAVVDVGRPDEGDLPPEPPTP